MFCGCVLHEVATNAAKYGGLSASGGMVSIAWDTESLKMILTWTEQGGPASTIAEALDLIAREAIDGAILDVNLPDGAIRPVLDARPKRVSVVVQTGVGLPPEIRAVHPDVPAFSIPTDPETLIRRLASALKK